jgi:hypothetical protein
MSTQPQTEEYLAARIESCRLLGLNPDDLTAHEAIRADLATVLRLWLDSSQSSLLAGGTADPVKLLSVVEALTKLVPEPEQRSHRLDPRQVMWETYLSMRRRGEIPPEGLTQAKISALESEVEQLKAEVERLTAGAGAPATSEPDDVPELVSSVPVPAGGNVVPLPRPNAPAAPAAPPAYDYDRERGWRDWVNADGSIRTTPLGGGKYWGDV